MKRGPGRPRATLEIPPALERLRVHADAARWLDELPALVSAVARDWQLRLGAPYDGSQVSLAAPVRRADGSEAVLKLQLPHRECAHEAEALLTWDGDGAVRLLAHDATRHALLLERCVPGSYLAEAGANTALDVLAGLLPRLWKPVEPGAPFTALADEATHWSTHLVERWEAAGRPCERRLVDAALAYLLELPAAQGETVLLHQDLHGHNVLAAQREPWLVIDPKPLAGEREFGIASIVRSFELGHSRAHVLGRLDRLTAELGLDRARATGWTIAQTVAWGFSSDLSTRHLETARWLLERS